MVPAGDAALVVELGDLIDPVINRRVHQLTAVLRRAAVPGVLEVVPSYRSLLVYYDPLRLRLETLRARINEIHDTLGQAPATRARVVEIPTRYGGEYGPDLRDVAAHNGLSPDEVVAIHAGADYLVYMMGFSPGFTYLGGMSARIATPRLGTPRTLIPAGSVGIAQQQTGIYPTASPGGWRLIGRTPIALFDARRDPPTVLEPGDYLRFIPVDEARYRAVATQVAAGTFRLVTNERTEPRD
jgi:KipI family sensor histidine kinase inhibitor